MFVVSVDTESAVAMDKIKDMLHGGHKKEGEEVQPATATTTATGGGYGQPGLSQTMGTTHPEGTHEPGHEKKGMFGLGGHHKVVIYR